MIEIILLQRSKYFYCKGRNNSIAKVVLILMKGRNNSNVSKGGNNSITKVEINSIVKTRSKSRGDSQ